jgi:hypothetical protein
VAWHWRGHGFGDAVGGHLRAFRGCDPGVGRCAMTKKHNNILDKKLSLVTDALKDIYEVLADDALKTAKAREVVRKSILLTLIKASRS